MSASHSSRSSIRSFLLLVSYFLLLALAHPALFGRLNFNLSNRKVDSDYRIIYENIEKENDFSRTVWISDIPPFAYASFDKPAIDGRKLIKLPENIKEEVRRIYEKAYL